MSKERLLRLLRLIDLIQARPGISAPDLAEACEVSERTIYRDLELLAEAGFPIVNEGYGKGYRFIGSFAIYPMDLTEEEALAFSMIPVWLERLGEQLSPAWRRAYEKVLSAHAKEKKNALTFLDRLQEVIQLGKPHYAPETRNLFPDIFRAIVNQKTIEALYHSQGRNETRWRRIDPYQLLPREYRLYLVGFCHDNQEFRTFRLSRFHEVKVLDECFERRPFNIYEYMRGTWSIERGQEEIRFVVRFSPEAARYVLEEELFLKPKFEEQEDGSVLMKVTVNSSGEFLRWLYGYGADAEILEPAEYRRRMRETLERWLKWYGTHPQ